MLPIAENRLVLFLTLTPIWMQRDIDVIDKVDHLCFWVKWY